MIHAANMNKNGWISIAWDDGGGVSAFFATRHGFFSFVTVKVLCYNKYTKFVLLFYMGDTVCPSVCRVLIFDQFSVFTSHLIKTKIVTIQ